MKQENNRIIRGLNCQYWDRLERYYVIEYANSTVWKDISLAQNRKLRNSP